MNNIACSLFMLVLFWQFTLNLHFWCKCGANLMHIFLKEIGSRTAPFIGAFLDELSQQHQHQRPKKKHPNQYQTCTFLVQIKCNFNAYLGWVFVVNLISWAQLDSRNKNRSKTRLSASWGKNKDIISQLLKHNKKEIL